MTMDLETVATGLIDALGMRVDTRVVDTKGLLRCWLGDRMLVQTLLGVHRSIILDDNAGRLSVHRFLLVVSVEVD